MLRFTSCNDRAEAPACDQQDQCKAERDGAMRNPHGDAGHVAGASDPEHLGGIKIRLRKHEAGKQNEESCSAIRSTTRSDAGMNRTRTSIRRCSLRRVTTTAPRN